MRSPRPRTSSLALLAAGLLTGCNLLSGVPGGQVQGTVTFDGRAATGVLVSLYAQKGDAWKFSASTATREGGAYFFANLADGPYQVRFNRSALDTYLGGRTEALRYVGEWSSSVVSVGMGGVRVPTFDLAYNGLIYPEPGKTSTYSPTQGLPFHWSAHRQAVSYRMLLADVSGGRAPVWGFAGDFSGEPYAVLTLGHQTGNYQWKVWIEAGSAGSGSSEVRGVDLDYLTPQAPAEEG